MKDARQGSGLPGQRMVGPHGESWAQGLTGATAAYPFSAMIYETTGNFGRSPSSLRLVALTAGWAMLAWFALRVAFLHEIARDVRAFQLAYLIGFAGFGLLCWAILRGGRPAPGRWCWWLIGCIALRLPLLSTAPSDDTYRYVWEGRVQLARFNPYITPPADPKLAPLRDAEWSRINHRDYPAIYPPLAQIEFAAVAAVLPDIHAVKAVHVAWDVLTMMVLASCLRRCGLRPHFAAIYGLCPLVLIAFAIEGHVDSLMLLAMALTAWALLCDRSELAGVAWGAAIAAKLVPVVLLPWFLLRRPRAVVVAAVVVFACYLPYLGARSLLLSSLTRFGAETECFSLFGTLSTFGLEWDLPSVAAPAALGVVVVILAWRTADFTAFAIRAWTALLMLTPVVHSWYLTWVIVLLPLRPRAAWLAAAAAFVVYFEAEHQRVTNGEWQMSAWAPVVAWATFLAVAVIEAAVRLRGNPPRIVRRSAVSAPLREI